MGKLHDHRHKVLLCHVVHWLLSKLLYRPTLISCFTCKDFCTSSVMWKHQITQKVKYAPWSQFSYMVVALYSPDRLLPAEEFTLDGSREGCSVWFKSSLSDFIDSQHRIWECRSSIQQLFPLPFSFSITVSFVLRSFWDKTQFVKFTGCHVFAPALFCVQWCSPGLLWCIKTHHNQCYTVWT